MDKGDSCVSCWVTGWLCAILRQRMVEVVAALGNWVMSSEIQGLGNQCEKN